MNILILASYLPYPLTNGGNVRLFNLIKRLSEKHELTLICEKRKYQNDHDLNMVKQYCQKVITFDRRRQWSFSNVLKTGFSLNSFLVSGHSLKTMKEKIKDELVSGKFDIVHVETFYILQNLPNTKLPIVLAEHNIEYMVYKRFADNAHVLLRPVLYLDIMKMRINEKMAWSKADKLLAVSEQDKRLMQRDDVVIIPNGIDLDSFPMKKPTVKEYRSLARHIIQPRKELLFIGDFKWMQNKDAVRWIIKDIWPFLLRAIEDEMKIKLCIVGKNLPENIKNLNSYDSVEFILDASDITAKIYKSADILLAPLRISGGSSFKILEAMASGVPVVTTLRGISGFDAEPDKHALIADDTRSFVEQTVRLLRDKDLYRQIALNGRQLVEEKYNWDIIAQKLDEVYKSLKSV